MGGQDEILNLTQASRVRGEIRKCEKCQKIVVSNIYIPIKDIGQLSNVALLSNWGQ